MADWMNQMANAVDEAEAANARAQEEVPTEPATSPRPPMVEVPVNDGRWTSDEYASCYGTSPMTSMKGTRLSCMCYWKDSKSRQEPRPSVTWKGKGNRHKLQNMKHTNEVSKNGMPRYELEGWMLHHFQAVHLLKAFHRNVYFQVSMRPFVRMIQVSLLIHSQL